jgi:hypothetical protein
MTLPLPPHLDAEIRAVADEEPRSVHQAVVHAVEQYLAGRETAEPSVLTASATESRPPSGRRSTG